MTPNANTHAKEIKAPILMPFLPILGGSVKNKTANATRATKPINPDAQYKAVKKAVLPGLMRIRENTASTSVKVEAKT